MHNSRPKVGMIVFYAKRPVSHSTGRPTYTDCRYYIWSRSYDIRRSQQPRGLRHRSMAARLLRSCVRIPPGAWLFVCCECCVLSGRGLCDGLIIRSEESYRLWRVAVCDQVTSYARRLKPDRGL